jgi:hypothetical protein
MGKEWDGTGVWLSKSFWQEVYRVLKPGGHMLVWSIPKTSHYTGTVLELAGFTHKDLILHVFGSGFPKSLNVSAAIDKMANVDTKKEQAIASYLRESREALGLTSAEVDRKVFGGSTRYAFVEGRNNEDGNFRIYLPTPEEWVKLKVVLKLDDRFDEYIKAAIPSRENRARADGGKADLVGTEEGSYGYQASGERWDKEQRVTKPTSEDAKKWAGWGTALKPAVEVWHLVRKPLSESNVAAQVLSTGTGAINIDGTRVKHASPEDLAKHQAGVTALKEKGGTMNYSWKNSSDLSGLNDVKQEGRWPAQLLLTHNASCKRVGTKTVTAPTINRFTDGMKPFGEGAGHPYESSGGGTEEQAVYECTEGCPVKAMNVQSGDLKGRSNKVPSLGGGGSFGHPKMEHPFVSYEDAGGASRFFQTFEPEVPFFYTAKASKSEKEAGLENMEGTRGNTHPTIKPISLMRYLVKMITPKGGIVLDPFAGSGSTLVAALEEGDNFIGIEREDEYIKIARKRIDKPASTQAAKDIFDLMMSGDLSGDEK